MLDSQGNNLKISFPFRNNYTHHTHTIALNMTPIPLPVP